MQEMTTANPQTHTVRRGISPSGERSWAVYAPAALVPYLYAHVAWYPTWEDLQAELERTYPLIRFVREPEAVETEA